MSNAETNILEINGLKRSFRQGESLIRVLCGVDLKICKGEIISLLGPSGSGKSTMLQAIGLLERGFQGSIRMDGREFTSIESSERNRLRREKLGFVYQFHHLLPDFDARENVEMPQLIAGVGREQARVRAEELLDVMGLAERMYHRPSQLSGGEQQRVAVARALANRPLLVLADEPTGNLDENTSEQVLSAFVSLVREEGSAAVVATHNRRLANKMDRVLELHNGKLKEL
jgi:lipoprotein-releasing system ATP-binding protein